MSTAFDLVASWPARNVAVGVTNATHTLDSMGEVEQVFPLASVTKLLTAYASLVALEEGAVELDEPAGPAGSTVRHLLAHAASYEFDTRATRGLPGERRMYSNAGFEVLAEHIEQATSIPFAQYAREAVFQPLEMHATNLEKSPAAGGESCVNDLLKFARELLHPTLLDTSTVQGATSVHFPGIDGLLPGFGRQKPNDWGLGFEIRGLKQPHWTGAHASTRTFGHFGQSGTFLWVDPDAQLACVVLTDKPFGPWAAEVWPPFSDAVLKQYS
ncbi:serine hydrolase domain-containing protein [Timonella sp. A28]|uniref:serine hydrolase domain-containing protein n=1 Tax=Timonella sp. A28 TaxID=3442640 RepID=UPI003EBB2073